MMNPLRPFSLLAVFCWIALAGLASTTRAQPAGQDRTVVWKIGESDDGSAEFALAPGDYAAFLERDFGWEDRFFLVGWSDPQIDWPYVLPGPVDSWAGSGGMAGRRTHYLNILFGLKQASAGEWSLVIDLVNTHPGQPPVLKVDVNGRARTLELPAGAEDSVSGNADAAVREHVIEIPLPADVVRAGGNEIQLTSLSGSWLQFDQVRLEGPAGAEIVSSGDVFLRGVEAATYSIEHDGQEAQPLLVDVQHLAGTPELRVRLDGEEIFAQQVEQGRYTLEAPMPAVTNATESTYEVLVDGTVIESGTIQRSPQPITTLAGYVDTRIGTAHSRWMIAPGPWMPFSMVKLSPHAQNAGWQAGYDPSIENIAGFSHIHEWTMAGLSMMPTMGPLQIHEGSQDDPDSGYRSRFDKSTEQAPIGYYSVDLTDYDIRAEFTSTTRAALHRYTFPQGEPGRVLLDLQFPAEYGFDISKAEIRKVDDRRVVGSSTQHSVGWGADGLQDYTVHFVVEFDQPIRSFGVWRDGEITPHTDQLQAGEVGDAGAYAEFDTGENRVVQARVGISLVSIENAALNLKTEIGDEHGWDFESVRAAHVEAWDELLGRIEIHTPDRREKARFYNNLYRSFCRNTWSDVNGQWVDATEQVRQLPEGRVALGCDAFWNTFWNLNQVWNLAAPEWSSQWVGSQLAMYEANGWLAKGPAGMEYLPVMVAEHEIPMIVAAYQMGIRDFDAELALEAAVHMQTTPAEKVGGGLAGNRDLAAYLEHRYVPYDKGRFSNSLEYSYDDWAVSQLARALGDKEVYETFRDRGTWWRNAIDPESGYARMRDSAGRFVEEFDFYRTGANKHYVEGNAWQLTFFVPQDVRGLAETIGPKRFAERLEWGFNESYPKRFNPPLDQYWDAPVSHGNQQSMHFAFLFNWAGKPWLTQYWSRAVLDRYYGVGTANAYLGDEDQGQMSAWFVMAAIGLFQTDGGCRADPIYEIGSPLYEKIVVNLGGQHGRGETFTIEAQNASRSNLYVQSATLNGERLDTFHFPASELLEGGELILEMGAEPSQYWGVARR